MSREPNTGMVLYLPTKVVWCLKYQAEKEQIAIDKEKEKEARRIRTEVNKRLKAEQAEEKAAQEVKAQLRKEQEAQNLASPKAPSAKPKSTTPNAKKAVSKVLKLPPLSAQPASAKSPKRSVQK